MCQCAQRFPYIMKGTGSRGCFQNTSRHGADDHTVYLQLNLGSDVAD